ncbi:unnamed protein product [Lampetra planeri]
MLLPLLKNGAPFRGLKLLAALGGLCLLQATLGAAAESRPPHPSPLYIRVNPLWYVGRGVRPIGRFGKRQMPWVSDAPVRIRQQETAWPDAGSWGGGSEGGGAGLGEEGFGETVEESVALVYSGCDEAMAEGPSGSRAEKLATHEKVNRLKGPRLGAPNTGNPRGHLGTGAGSTVRPRAPIVRERRCKGT